MKIEDIVLLLLREMDRIHPKNNANPMLWREPGMLPDFVTTKDGFERHFSTAARSHISDLSIKIFENNSTYQQTLELLRFEEIVRQSVADVHAENEFELDSIEGRGKAYQALADEIQAAVNA